jgi:hypothetical protein
MEAALGGIMTRDGVERQKLGRREQWKHPNPVFFREECGIV